ncbi:MAG TPA: HD domain-containing protein, partial [Clostridiales bacterium]|nr:HD domain-containing protein [Clostridiales bacterium]
MKRKKIIELEIGEEIEGFFLIKEVGYKTASNAKNYLDMTLSDGTGEINAKLWECSEKEASLYQLFQLVKVRAQVTEWQGKKQLKITKMRTAQESDGLNIEDFVPSAPLKPEKMFEIVEAYIGKIANEDIKRIVQGILEEDKERILYYPAAKTNHHAIRSGLLYHIVRMLELAEKLSEIYPFVNRDLLFAGVILHDIAKVDEMIANPLGMVKDYTAEGQLLGHIVQGIKRVAKAGEQVG